MIRAERVAKVAAALQSAGLRAEILSLADNTATAAAAAAALGCEIGDIAKSLMFCRISDNAPVLAILGGDVRADIRKLSAAVNGKVKKANADFVKQNTGYEIGGVPPLAHLVSPLTIMDSGLLKKEKVWAAAGSPFAVFPSNPTALAKAAKAKIADIAE